MVKTSLERNWRGPLLSRPPIWGGSSFNIRSEWRWHRNGFLHWIILFSSSPSKEATSHPVRSRYPSCHTCLITFNSLNIQHDNVSQNYDVELSQIHPNPDGQPKIWYPITQEKPEIEKRVKKSKAYIREYYTVKSGSISWWSMSWI